MSQLPVLLLTTLFEVNTIAMLMTPLAPQLRLLLVFTLFFTGGGEGGVGTQLNIPHPWGLFINLIRYIFFEYLLQLTIRQKR